MPNAKAGGGASYIGASAVARTQSRIEAYAHFTSTEVLPFGYRTDDFKGRGARRKPIAEMAHSERFGNEYVSA